MVLVYGTVPTTEWYSIGNGTLPHICHGVKFDHYTIVTQYSHNIVIMLLYSDVYFKIIVNPNSFVHRRLAKK